MDHKAYISPELWQSLIHQFEINEAKLRDMRYDLVIHLSSSMNCKDEYYEISNDLTQEQIQKLDQKLIEAWLSHPNFIQISNVGKSQQEKLNLTIKTVFEFLGIFGNYNFFKKFIVSNPEMELVPLLTKKYHLKVHNFDIKDVIFFQGDQQVTYYRQRIEKNLYTYLRCEKSKENGQYSEKKRQVSIREFKTMYDMKAKNKFIMRKKRSAFMFKSTFIVLDTIKAENNYFSICRIQLLDQKVKVEIPPLIQNNMVMEISGMLKRQCKFFFRIIGQRSIK